MHRRRVPSHTPPPHQRHRNSATTTAALLAAETTSQLLPLYHQQHHHHLYQHHNNTLRASVTTMMEMTTNNGSISSINGHAGGVGHYDYDDDLRNPHEPIPTFAFSEIRLGRMVGRGGFSIVNEVERIVLDEVFDTSEEESQRRKALANPSSSTSSSTSSNNNSMFTNQRYVLKTLRNDLPEEEHVKGIVDLAIEAEFLSTLSHPNIITMRAMANSDPHESKFFVLLDRLIMTLDRKFNAWRKQVGENIGVWMGPCCGYCCAKRPELYRIWMERLVVARDIANALRYLHSQAIVYRDLKPDNCGFTLQGQLKLFDFGLAKRMDPQDRTANGLFTMTGNTGSLRYMAPEVANCEPYDQRCDAYSFGILFWQICSLTTPYAGFSLKMHADRVVRLGQRPKPDPSWPSVWVNLMTECWSAEYVARPSMDAVVHILTQEVLDLEQEEGMIPTRATERIRAKYRKKKRLQQPNQLDVDTRLSTIAATTTTTATTTLTTMTMTTVDQHQSQQQHTTTPNDNIVKRFDTDIV